MKSIIAAAGLTLALGIAGATAQTTPQGQTGQAQSGQQMSQAQCQQVWQRMNPSGAQSVSQQAAQPYIQTFSQADQNSDGQLSAAEFNQACQRGLVQDTATTGGGAGTGGTGGTKR